MPWPARWPRGWRSFVADRVDGGECCRFTRRIDRGRHGEREPSEDHDPDIEGLDPDREVVDEVDRGVDRDDVPAIEGCGDEEPEDQPPAHSDPADHDPLDQEDPA